MEASMENSESDLLLEGNDLFNAGDYTHAIEKYELAIQKNPDFAEAYYNWGQALYNLNDFKGAIEKYELAIQKKPDYVLAYDYWGLALYSLNDFKGAIEKYDLAIQKDPDYAQAYNNWGLALSKQNDFKGAIEKYDLAIQKDPDYTLAYINWGSELDSLNDFKGAIEKYELAIQKDPDYATAYNNWGLALNKLNDFKGAIEKYELAVQKDPDYASAYNNWGLALDNLNDFKGAIEKYELAIQKKPDYALAYNNWGLALSKVNDFKGAIEKYDLATQKDPDYADAYYNWGSDLYSLNDFKGAIEKYDLALQKDPDYGSAYLGRARIYIDKGAYESAYAEIQKAVEIKPDYYSYLELGNLYGTQREYEKAIEQYRIAIDKGGNKAYPYFMLGYILTNLKRYEEAIKQYEMAEEMPPDGPSDFDYVLSSHNHADILQQQGKYDQARKAWKRTYDKYLEIEPIAARQHNSNILYYAGSIAWEFFQEFDEKEKAFKTELLFNKGLEIDPENIDLLLSLVEFYVTSKGLLEYGGSKLDRGNTWLAQVNAISRQTNDERALIQRSVDFNWQAMQKFQKLKQAVGRKLENAEAQELDKKQKAGFYLTRAKANLAVERYEDGKKDAQKAAELDDQSADAYSTLGAILMRLEEYKAAILSFKTAVDLDVDNLAYISNLAEAYRKAEMLDEAKRQYEFALKISPFHLDSIIGMAETYAALGDGPLDGKKSEDAEEMYTRAIEFYSRALVPANRDNASKVLKPQEIAAVRYARGYACAKLFESQSRSDEKLLRDARSDFESIPSTDKNYHKARRSIAKIAEKLRPFSPNNLEQKAGVWVIAIAVFAFLVGQFIFFVGQPQRVPPGYKFSIAGVEALKEVGIPEDLLVNIGLLVPQRFDSQQALGQAVNGIVGDAMTLEIQKLIVENMESVPGSTEFQPVDVGYYALFTFGPLIFVVAGAYLQQISKLKFAGIEIEKSSVDQISTSSSLGISK
jgi:tetratricopeptide (TPR) repeat protein